MILKCSVQPNAPQPHIHVHSIRDACTRQHAQAVHPGPGIHLFSFLDEV